MNNISIDNSLHLRMDYDQGYRYSVEEALLKLNKSELVHILTSEIKEKPLFYIWRLIALSEIPYSRHLKYTQDLIDRIYNKLSTPFGFSLGGDKKSFLPCYNAMLVSALCRLGQGNDSEVKKCSRMDWTESTNGAWADYSIARL